MPTLVLCPKDPLQTLQTRVHRDPWSLASEPQKPGQEARAEPKKYGGLPGTPEATASTLPTCEQDAIGPIPQVE